MNIEFYESSTGAQDMFMLFFFIHFVACIQLFKLSVDISHINGMKTGFFSLFFVCLYVEAKFYLLYAVKKALPLKIVDWLQTTFNIWDKFEIFHRRLNSEHIVRRVHLNLYTDFKDLIL